MPAKTDIPLKYTAPAPLKGELERFAVTMDTFTREAQTRATRVAMPDVNRASPALSYGQVQRAPTVLDGATLDVLLPRPNPVDIGRRCGIARSSITGTIVIHAVGGTVGDAVTYTMTNDLHFVEFLLGNDLNFYPSRAGAGTA